MNLSDDMHNDLAAISVDRKQALHQMGSFGKKMVAAILSVSSVGLLTSPAQAQFRDLDIVRALNFILQMEFLQERFYVNAITKKGFLPSGLENIFSSIKKNQSAIVIYLKNTIVQTLKGNVSPQVEFNFTVSGRYKPYESLDDFLYLAQIIEDTGVAMYKKQIEILHKKGVKSRILRDVVRAHSTETRHAYYVRSLRAQHGHSNLKGWINNKDGGTMSGLVTNIYAKEDTTTHQGIDVPSITNAPLQAVEEAWDEPMGRTEAESVMVQFSPTYK